MIVWSCSGWSALGLRTGSGGDRIELVPFLSNADPLNLGGASFEAQNGKRVRPSASGLVPRATCDSCQSYITPSWSPSQPSPFPFPALNHLPLAPRYHHDGLFRVRAPLSSLSCISSLLSSSSLAFSTLADPHSWAAPSPLDSPDPVHVFDSILYPTFEREIVSISPLSPHFTCPVVDHYRIVYVSVLQLYLLRAQHPRPARATCPFRGHTRRICTCHSR